MRGRRLNRLMLLAAILAAGMLLAAHVPLHDLELAGAHHDDYDHQPVDHEHPVRTLAIAIFSAILIVVAFVLPMASPSPQTVADRRQPAGPLWCDDDIGLHGLLSVYQI